MSARAQIAMSEEEVLAFLAEQRTMICATNGPRGWPHLMPLWYVLRPSAQTGAPRPWAWTFAKSQ
jgi:nitroimidazol reductase NimA-like FMN-containing flavoprotein (pyridoxamine 5'-phosphate oxidase superfamily)